MSPARGDSVTLRHLRPDDFPAVVAVADEWWDGRQMAPLFHRLYFDHFGSTSFVAERDGRIVGFLIGFLSPSQPAVAYSHLVAVDPAERGQGIGRRLYDTFTELARHDGRQEIHAICVPSNKTSIAFHRGIGFQIVPGDAVEDGVSVHTGYRWDGAARVRLLKSID
jgi:GNAT superfamily N-acetyltransferase